MTMTSLITSFSVDDLGDNCIQNFHLGRYIVGYMVGNLVLKQFTSGSVKRDFLKPLSHWTATVLRKLATNIASGSQSSLQTVASDS